MEKHRTKKKKTYKFVFTPQFLWFYFEYPWQMTKIVILKDSFYYYCIH